MPAADEKDASALPKATLYAELTAAEPRVVEDVEAAVVEEDAGQPPEH